MTNAACLSQDDDDDTPVDPHTGGNRRVSHESV